MTSPAGGEPGHGDARLRGRRIAVTRPAAPGDEFVSALERLGAEVVSAPLIRLEPPHDPAALRDAARRAGEYPWLVFTSANAVRHFVAARAEVGAPAWPGGGSRVCAVGPATAAEVERSGGRVTAVPGEYVGEAVADAMIAQGLLRGQRVLFPRAADARPVVAASLRERGAEVDDVVAYRTVRESAGALELRERLARGELDAITFTSGSAVRSFVAQVGNDVGRAVVACIGPITAAAARGAGLTVAVEAAEYTTGGLVAALVERLAGASTESTS